MERQQSHTSEQRCLGSNSIWMHPLKTPDTPERMRLA